MNCTDATVNGYYQQGVSLDTSNTITLPVNVTAPGKTTINTNTVDGMSFTSGPITFTNTGLQNVTLTGSGTPSTASVKAFTLTGTPGGATPCNINITVNAAPVSYTINCTATTVAGNYIAGTPMASSNTMTITVDVQYLGAYSLETNVANGVKFTATGTFTNTGVQNIIMTAQGTPTQGGTFTFNFSNGASSCSKDITFTFRKMNILSLGNAGTLYHPGGATTSESARAILVSAANFGANGTVPTNEFNIVPGNTPSGATLKSLINTNKIDIIIVGYNFNPDAIAGTVLNDFVKNKKGAIIYSQELNNNNLQSLLNTILNTTGISASLTSPTQINPVTTVNDPILNGPFLDLKGKLLGSDVNNSMYITGLPADVTVLATKNGTPSSVFAFKHNTLGFFFIGDSGWMAGNASSTDPNIYPSKFATGGVPTSKTYNGGTIFNAHLYANSIAWAIDYAQQNINANYVIP